MTGGGTGRVSYDYSRYLAAKTTVDDRALNRYVLAQLRAGLPAGPLRGPEVGAGLGTMVARLLDWGVLAAGDYTLVDVDEQLLLDSRTWLRDWAGARGVRCEPLPDGLALGALRVHLVRSELGEYLAAGTGTRRQPADLLIANAFLDLVDVPAMLPTLLGLLAPGGRYWFTINYDGDTAFCPDHHADEAIMRAYHLDMDERVRYGRPAGDSRTGRHLLGALRAAGAPVVAAGASDWVVHPAPEGGYAGDEAYFVDCILRTVGQALTDRVDRALLEDWVAIRRRQLDHGQLVYLAHQLDVTGAKRT